MKNYKGSLWVVLLFIALAVAGCSTSQIRIGWIGTQSTDHMAYQYERFKGIERAAIYVQGGETLALAFDAEVEDGILVLQVIDPDEAVLWERTLRSDSAGDVRLPMEQEGHYKITIKGQDTKGKFETSWEIQ